MIEKKIRRFELTAEETLMLVNEYFSRRDLLPAGTQIKIRAIYTVGLDGQRAHIEVEVAEDLRE